MREYHIKFLETDSNYSRLSSIYPSFALSDFYLSCRFQSLADTLLYAASEAPPDCKLCSLQFLQSRLTDFRNLTKFSPITLYKIGLFFVYLFIYLFIYFVRKLNFFPLLKLLK